MRRRYAPRVWQGEVVQPEDEEELVAEGCRVEGCDARTVAELMGVGLDVGFDRRRGMAQGDDEKGEVEDGVEKEVFCKWVELSEPPLGSALGRWWAYLDPGADGDDRALKVRGDDVAADLFEQVVKDCRELELLGPGEALTVAVLARWCRRRVGPDYGAGEVADLEELADLMRLELCAVSVHFGMGENAGAMEAAPDGMDADEEARMTAFRAAGKEVVGWPGVGEEPTQARQPGRLPKSFPLEFPMGLGGVHDPRPRAVGQHEYTQHMLRLQSGQCVAGARQHRLVWALVNGVLLDEAAGKGYAVHRVLLRRLGGRLRGHELMTRAGLKEMMEQAETARLVTHQLMTVGRSVRSTPMQWAYEQKKLDTMVKYMSWCPPWVRGEDLGGFDF